ncbi:hypothetical protein BX600DRAFT_441066 [Xylariales sp. PMI_506]|nr:hypothetical protein BX600DRAFT_441066 [Xylariales sp. PMI_506]
MSMSNMPSLSARLSGCDNIELNSHCDKYDDPIALTKAAEDIPDYLDRVISLCRQEDPPLRPSAHEVLRMFSTDNEILQQINLLDANEFVTSRDESANIINTKLTRLEDVRDIYGVIIICAICDKSNREFYYNCQTCDFGNDDICHKCFLEGKNCYCTTHMLEKYSVEAQRNKGAIKPLAYYPSVGGNGEREQIVV